MNINKSCTNESVKRFYDDFSKRLMADYVHGNPRVEAAISHALRWIPADAERILDVGCGIGWSTWEIKRNHPEAFVLGVDISGEMVRISRNLFQAAELEFAVNDISEGDGLLENPFDAIVMLDVYEHIPRELRNRAHQILRKALEAQGHLVLTFPSISHQSYLRAHEPNGLQVVDEEVGMEDIHRLALDVDGQVISLNHVTIWHDNDYVHAVIKRNSELTSSEQSKEQKSVTALESKEDRAYRLRSRLQVRVTREGFVLPTRERPVVCIVFPNQNAYSETFIRAHIEQLPAKVEVLYGGYFPKYKADREPLLTGLSGLAVKVMGFFPRVCSSLSAKVANFELKRFFLKHHVELVLAEYGPTGAAVTDACLQAGVPLVVHFHGFDLYHRAILEKYDSRYRRMFSAAKALVTVSHEMTQRLQDLGAPMDKIFYNSCGVDTSLFSGADPAHAGPVCVAVGRFVDKKAPHLTVLAFKEAVSKCPDARLIMIGDGPLWQSSEKLARELGLEGAVEFLGQRSHAEIATIMRKARMFVQHSVQAVHGDSEGTPVAILEAGASGLPVVATRHAGIRDVVVEGQTGLLADEGDVEGMAANIIQLAQDPVLAARLGTAARERICAQFSMQESMARLWRIMEAQI
jgi:colanic acid/amylovoran biosynthesis glycosyltransferase